MSELLNAAHEELIALLGVENIVPDQTVSFSTWCPPALKARQAGTATGSYAAVVSPGTTAEVAQLVTWANRHRVILFPVGGASSTVGDPKRDGPVVAVRLSRLNEISWDESAITVTVGSGVVLAELEEQLNAHSYTLGSLPQSARLATAGGAVATEAFGLFAAGYGGLRDLTVGLEAVLPGGAIVQTSANGAASRTLHHLLIGSEGAFGIVTAVTLAMYSLPEVRAWCTFTFAKVSDALDALRLVYRSDARPGCVRLFDAVAARDKFPPHSVPSGYSVLLFGFEGSEIVQTGHYQTAYAVCQQVGGTDAGLDGDNWLETERYRSDAFAANGRPGGIADVISVYASWSSLPAAYTALRDGLSSLCSDVSLQIGWADAHGAALDFRFETDASTAEDALALHSRILQIAQQTAQEHSIRVAHHYGIGLARRAWAEAERGSDQLAALRSLKSALDPNGIFPPI